MTEEKEPEVLITDIRTQNEAFLQSSQGQALAHVVADIFSGPSQYLFEIVQNALDERATAIRITMEFNETLVIEHNGDAFTAEDVVAVCEVGLSTKKKLNSIGFMGIGFKAAFRRFSHVSIGSGRWHFGFRCPVREGPFGDKHPDYGGMILPEWENAEIATPAPDMTCRFVLSEPRMDEEDNLRSDVNALFDADGAILAVLAKRGLQRLEALGDTWQFSLSQTLSEAPGVCVEDVTQVHGDDAERWLFFSRTYQPSRSAVRQLLERRHQYLESPPDDITREVSLFCRVGTNGLEFPGSGQIFNTLPVGQTWPLGLHIQADWLPTIARDGIVDVYDAWQHDILAQVPELLAGFFWWLTSNYYPGPRWAQAYQVLNVVDSPRNQLDEWYIDDSVQSMLHDCLASVPLLPVRDSQGMVRFRKPNDSRCVPDTPEFAELASDDYRPWFLWGPDVFCLGSVEDSDVFAGIRALGLLRPLEPQHILPRWKQGSLKKWWLALPESSRMSRYLDVLNAIARHAGWREADLPCLLTEEHQWVEPSRASRLPADWNAVVNTEWAGDLKRYVGTPLLAWALETAVLRRPRTGDGVESWLDSRVGTKPKLASLCELWWQDLPDALDPPLRARVTRYSLWARKINQVDLIRRVVCDTEQGPSLLEPTAAYIGEPYADASRRSLFGDVPWIVSDYLELDSDARTWSLLFKKLGARGGFKLVPMKRKTWEQELQQSLLANEYIWIRQRFQGSNWRFDGEVWDRFQEPVWAGRVTVGDWRLPDVWTGAANSHDEQQMRTIIQWIDEDDSPIEEITGDYRTKWVAYFPSGQYHIEERKTRQAAQWIHELSAMAWIPCRGRKGLFKIAEVLPDYDPERPDAPVAELPRRIHKLIERAGFTLGTEVPPADAVYRFERSAALPATDRRLRLRDVLAAAAEDESVRDRLLKLLRSRRLLPTAPDQWIPGASLDRLAKEWGPWTSLGGWVVALRQFPKGHPDRELLEHLCQVWEMPEFTSAAHAVAFLRAIWASPPTPEDPPFRAIPTAYECVANSLRDRTLSRVSWDAVRDRAKVLLKDGRWAAVTDPNIYVDDLALPSSALVGALSLQDRVEPRQFGASMDIFVDEEWRIRRVSKGYRREVVIEAPIVHNEYYQALRLVHNLSCQYQKIYQRDPFSTEGRGGLVLPERVDKAERLALRVVSDKERREFQKHALLQAGHLLVSGTSSEFASDCAEELAREWGLQGPVFPFRLVRLIQLWDEPAEFRQIAKDIADEFGLEIPVESLVTYRPPSGDESTSTDQGTESTDSGRESSESAEESTATDQGTESTDTSRGSSESAEESTATDQGTESTDSGREASGSAEEAQPTDQGRSEFESSSTHRERAQVDGRSQRLRGTKRLRRRQILRKLLAHLVMDLEREEQRWEFQSDTRYRKAVIEYERSKGRLPVEMGPSNEGFDIESFSYRNGSRSLERRIEVKGTRAPWNSVFWSRPQMRAALEHLADPNSPEYWVYVVEGDVALQDADVIVDDVGYCIYELLNPAEWFSGVHLKANRWGPWAK